MKIASITFFSFDMEYVFQSLPSMYCFSTHKFATINNLALHRIYFPISSIVVKNK